MNATEQRDSTDPEFESLLAEVAGRLLGSPLDAMDAAIDDALSRLVASLEVEHSTLRLIDPVEGTLRVTHGVAVPSVERTPIGQPESEMPWLAKRMRTERSPVIFSCVSDLPPDAGRDPRGTRAHGVKSNAIFPIAVGEQLLGALSFGTVRVERAWHPATVDRLRLVAEVFAGVFLRVEHERRLQAAQAELEVLRARLQTETEYLRDGPFVAEGFDDIVGESAALRSVLFMAEQVAPTDATVLLLGETGTGKELVARAIHVKSHRRDRTLVKVNCAALPPTLIESELFGHEKGAFTGAASRKIGRFELADRGTLFLDEISELPLALQAKLLRVLQEGEFERLGSSVTHKADVRIIAASNRDLAAAAREGSFRSDLYYRLGVFPIDLPPLRARAQDIPLLVWHFLGQLGSALGRKIERVPAPTMERLIRYAWPGNIRELRNVLERAVILSPGPTLMLDELADERRTPVAAAAPADGCRPLADVEHDHIVRVLDACQWRVRGAGNAAKQLGLNASTLYSRMKKLGIHRPNLHPRGDVRDQPN
jgi:transcriptional regulator with GAF, ATPase, and Fis domain